MAEIKVTPENGLFGKEVNIKIGDTVKVELDGINWKPGGKSFADTNVSPLKFKDPAIRNLTTKRMEFKYLARATGWAELAFSSDDKSVQAVKVIVAK